jgi:DNA-directed RNA polymerase I, II, and III subunit RPABC2
MSDYENYDDYEELDIEEFENEEKYESDIENNEEKEKYIDSNIDNIEENENDDELKFINEDIIFNSENIKTTKYLTIYEKTAIIGQRAEELYKQYKKEEFMPFVDITEDMINEYNELNFIKIAEKELEEKKIPYMIQRLLPNDKYVIVDLKNLILKDKY